MDEQTCFFSRHERPRDDRVAVPGTSIADLNHDAVAAFAAAVRRNTPALIQSSDLEILQRLNAISATGEATVAGLYALGIYPQQFLPHLSLTAAVIPAQQDGKMRALNRMDFTGPLPEILDGAVEWVAQNVSQKMLVTNNGEGQTEYSFPLVAVREIVANALVHRDLSDATSGRCVELRLTPNGLALTNPGGLWGLSVAQLGTPDGKSAVNEFLYTICRHVSGRSGRVIEAMGTGIIATRDALQQAGLEPPIFEDNSLRFTVRFPSHALHSEVELAWLSRLPLTDLTSRQKEVLLHLKNGAKITNSIYRKITGTDSTTARSELQDLVTRGLLVRTGQRRGTQYHLAPTLQDETEGAS